ncbi:sorbosone dehydrogenase family protein [Bacillus carboniphilus]|uniref:Sorbosone dehydrogenase family protein n=1 Tax=Bacillus carboniphilus TaxID=86663 RepID=A0ABP3GC70_9BACI
MNTVKSMLLLVLFFACVVLTACQKEESKEESREALPVVTGAGHEILLSNLQTPWSIQKHNDTFYISERTGYIYMYDGETKSRQTVQLQERLAQTPEAGLLGFIIPPRFTETKEAYAYYTYQRGEDLFNRLTILKQEGNQWVETKPLLDGIPASTFHHGGRLQIGPDQKLYVTTGDATVPETAQDPQSINGKILRMNLDGTIPTDNPFPNSYVYSYGHRNPQGLTWSPDGTMYSTEHGQSALDEINIIQAGRNYGWPIISGDQKREGMEAPLIHSGSQTWAPSGMDFHKGWIYFAGLRGVGVYRYHVQNQKLEKFIEGYGRVRDVWIDQDILYFVTNNTDGRGNPDDADDKLVSVPLSEES